MLRGGECSATSPVILLPCRSGGALSRLRTPPVVGQPGPIIGRVDVSEPASISTSIAQRYATAIFEIAQDNKNLDGLESGIDDLETALRESADLRAREVGDGNLNLVFIVENADDPEQSFFWQDPGYALALHSPSADPRELEVVHAPPELEWVGEVPGRRIELVHGADVPHAVEQRDDWPHEDLPAALWRWWRGRGPSQRETWGHLLGYPAVSSLAYDPTPGPEWLPLLSLSSVDELDFCWHDGNPLHVFIERERLAAGDFSSLRADAG